LRHLAFGTRSAGFRAAAARVRRADVTDTHADAKDPSGDWHVADFRHADVSSRDAEGSAPRVHPGFGIVRLGDRNSRQRPSLVRWVRHADMPTQMGPAARGEAIAGRPVPLVAAPPVSPYATSMSGSTNWLL